MVKQQHFLTTNAKGNMAVRKDIKTGKWTADFYISGKKVKKTGFATKKEASEYITARKESDRTEQLSQLRKNYETKSFQWLAELYMNSYLKHTKAVDNQSYIRNLIKKWGDYTLAEISPAEVREWIMYMINETDYAIATVERYFSYFKRVYNWGIEYEKINHNQFSKLSFKKEFKKATVRNVTMNTAEFEECYALFENERWYVKGIVLMLWHTGMRIGEIVNLMWREVNTAEGVIVLNPEKVKEGKVRTIGLEPEIIALLDKLENINARKGVNSKQYVFGVTKDNPLKYVTFWKSWRRVVKGTKFEKFNIHDIRHCYTKRKRQEGADREVIKIQQGHSTDSMFDRYNDIDKEEVTNMSGFNKQKRDVVEQDIKCLIEKAKENGVPIGTVQTLIRENL